MKTTTQPPKCECPAEPGHRVQITKARGKYFMTVWSTLARRCAAVLRWLSMFASPRMVADDFETAPDLAIEGAIAECVIRDLISNGFRFRGIPQISVDQNSESRPFIARLKFGDAEVTFHISKGDALRAARCFMSRWPADHEFFDLVQGAIAKLEAVPCK